VLPSPSLLRWEFLPFSPALSWDPSSDADEVSLYVIGAAADWRRGVSAEEEAEAQAVQRRLHELGVPQGAWHGTWRRDASK
jgi:hypothetical protein